MELDLGFGPVPGLEDEYPVEMDLEPEDEEPSVLEYARAYGLCRDYTQEQPVIDQIPTYDYQADLESPSDVPLANPAAELTKERLTISKETASLLKEVLSMGRMPDDAPLDITEDSNSKRASRLKQEVPLLSTDPELDLLEFGSTAIPILRDLNIPLEVVDLENGEGLEWPHKYFEYPKIWDDRIKAEKLVISKDDLRFLQDAIRDLWVPEDSRQVKEGCLSYKRSAVMQPVTPPLLPLSPPLTPYITSSPGNHLELLSESTNATGVELEALDKQTMRNDALVPSLNPEQSDESMLFAGLDDTSPSQLEEDFQKPGDPLLKRRAEDLKVEGPLTSPMFSSSPMKRLKSVSFPEMLHEFIPNLPSHFESGNDVLDPDDSFAEFLKEVGPLVEKTNRRIENEKLSEADTTRRVEVPDVDPVMPVAPWTLFSRKKGGKHGAGDTELDAQIRFIQQIKRNDLKTYHSWHGGSAADRDLQWSPFLVQPASVTIDEKLHGEEQLNDVLLEPTTGNVATSSTDIWKRDGLRILEENDSDDDLNPVSFEKSTTIDVLVKKRKLEFEEHDDDGRASDAKTPTVPLQPPRDSVHQHNDIRQPKYNPESKRRSSMHQHSQPQENHDNSLMFGGMFSASAALQQFMEVHGKSVVEPTIQHSNTSSHSKSKAPSAVNSPAHATVNMLPQTAKPPNQGFPQDMPPSILQMPPPPLPQLPSVPRKLPPCSFIISSTLLQQRSLTREVQTIYQAAELMERDFSLPHSPAQEADLLLSPSTGLIFTTLQQIKQKALPGRPDKSPVKERIARLQARYERLIVLVSEGLTREAEGNGFERLVDSRDKDAISEYETFAAVMEAEVLVKLVRGGEQALTRTIVREMVEYGLPHGSKDIGGIKLLQDETYWEIFLRRLGLNPFAAQVILASLKEKYMLPIVSNSQEASDASEKAVEVFGLPAFILMSSDERIQRFQALLGGSRILKRTSKLLDQQWPSAVHGFAV